MSPPPAEPNSRIPRFALWATAILCVLSIAFVYAGRLIGPNDLFRKDQGKTMAYTVDVIVNGRFSLPRDPIFQPATKPPLYNWLAAAFVGPTGIYDEWAHKIPSLIGALAVAAMVFVWCRRNFAEVEGKQHAMLLAMLAGAIWVASKSTILLLYIARPDMLQATCLVGAWLAGHAALKQPTRRDARRYAALFWLATTAAALAKGPAAVYPMLYVLLAAPLLFGNWRRMANVYWEIGLPILLGTVGLWLWCAARQDWPHVRDVLLGAEVAQRIAVSRIEGGSKPWWQSIEWFRTQNTVWSYLMFGSMAVTGLGSVKRLRSGGTGIPACESSDLRSDTGRNACATDRCFDLLRIRATDGFFTGAAGAANLWALVVVGCLSVPKDKRQDFLLPAHPAAAILAAHFLVYLVTRFTWTRFALPLAGALFVISEKRTVGNVYVAATLAAFACVFAAIIVLRRANPRLLTIVSCIALVAFIAFEIATNTRFGFAKMSPTLTYVALFAGAAVVASLLIAALPRHRLDLPLVAGGVIFWGYALLQNNYQATGEPGATNPSVYAARFAKEARKIVGDEKVVMLIRSKSPVMTLMGRHQGSTLTREDFEDAKWVIAERTKFPALIDSPQEAFYSGKLDIDFGHIAGNVDIYKDRVGLFRIENGRPSVDEMISIHRWVTDWTKFDANPYRSANTGWIDSPDDPPMWTPPAGDPWEAIQAKRAK